MSRRQTSALANLIAGRPAGGGPKPVQMTGVIEQVTSAAPLTCQPLSGGPAAEVYGQVTASVGDLVLVVELGAGLRIAVAVL